MNKCFSKTIIILMIFTLIGRLAYAADLPQIYGRINKEIKYIKQDPAAMRKQFYGPTEVDGAESNLGVKGKVPAGPLTANYKLEIGVNSSRNNQPGNNAPMVDGLNSDQRIRIRYAFASVGNPKWGTVLVGQEALAGYARLYSYDPLAYSGAQLIGGDYSFIAGYAGNGYPILPRGFSTVNQINYSTPVMSGVRLLLSHDFNNQTNSAKTIGTPAEDWWSGEFDYDIVLKDISNISVTGVYSTQQKRGVIANYESAYWQLGLKSVINDKTKLSVIYVSYYKTDNVQDKSWFGSISYDLLPKLTLAVTYTTTAFSNYVRNNAAYAAFDINGSQGSQRQWAIGGIYKFSENISTRLVYANYYRRTPGGMNNTVPGTLPDDPFNLRNSNTAHSLLGGLLLTF